MVRLATCSMAIGRVKSRVPAHELTLEHRGGRPAWVSQTTRTITEV